VSCLRVALLCFFGIAAAAVRGECRVEPDVDIGLSGYTLTSPGRLTVVAYGFSLLCPDLQSGTHRVTGSDYRIVATNNVPSGSALREWTSNLVADGQAGLCYRAYIEGTNGVHEQGRGTSAFCLPTTTQPKNDPTITDCSEYEPAPCGQNSPIVIDLARGMYRLTDVHDGVMFDIDADGTAERVAWTRDGAVAFLFFDRNGNGTPDHGGELFGDHTPLGGGRIARNGFEALAQFDSNGDGVVNAADAQWGELQLWQDHDHDGRAAADEITPLSGVGVQSLEVSHQWTGRRDRYGNAFRWKATVAFADERRPYYDVYLVTAR
jgi:hypothetical protein